MFTFSFLKKPTLNQKKQMLDLYHAENWWPENIQDPDRIDDILKGSHCILVVSLNSEIAGMGRAISDNTGDAYLHDITVKKQFRGRGIGDEIVSRLIERLKNDGIKWIGLIAENNSHKFYEKHNLKIMNNSKPMYIEV